jgi:hypothetical protein
MFFAVLLGAGFERRLMESVIGGLCEFEHLKCLIFRRVCEVAVELRMNALDRGRPL